jgi:hypothetical protein
MMPWWRISSNIKAMSSSSHVPFFQRGRWLKNDGHDVIIIRPRKDIRARVVHQLVTKTSTVWDNTQDKWSTATEQDVVDGTFLYVLRNIERGFDTVESSRSLLLRDIRNRILYPRRRSGGLCYLAWTYKRFLQHLISSYAELYTHSMEKNWQKTLPRYQ